VVRNIGRAAALALVLAAGSASGEEPSLLRTTLGSRHALSIWPRTPNGAPRDVLENRTYASLSAHRREDETLTWELGARFDLSYPCALGQNGTLARPSLSPEIRPWEAWVDVALGSALRMRAGNQIFTRGKLDALSAGAVLGALDLRQGPSAEMDQLRMPLPLALATWTPAEDVTIELGWAPFFVPHRFDVYGSNYALLAPTASAPVARAIRSLRDRLSDETFDAIAEDLSRTTTPDRDLGSGEAVARTALKVGSADVSATWAWVREKLPTLALSPALRRFVQAPLDPAVAAELTASRSREPLVAARYHRYQQLALDVEGTAGAFTFVAESGLSLGRRTLARTEDDLAPAPVEAAVVQGGAGLTYVGGESFFLTVQATAIHPATTPRDSRGRRRDWIGYGGLPVLGVAIVACERRWEHDRIALQLLGTTSGPSVAAVARYAHRFGDSFDVGAGVAWFVGRASNEDSIAAFSDRFDQVFVSAEWKR
jgi:hypothetical protein